LDDTCFPISAIDDPYMLVFVSTSSIDTESRQKDKN
jgi:hypothetical protein